MEKDILNSEQTALDLQDLLVDESNDVLSEYLSLSIEHLSGGTKISVTTVEAEPATYSSTLTGVTITDLHCLLDVPIDS
ncbi:MAG: type I secretion C-terminal target domain-containing protein [Cycloclasticus sp.]|nr:type I secretion C-terminal target domain-containing protein [Cycloclasticus sp.]